MEPYILPGLLAAFSAATLKWMRTRKTERRQAEANADELLRANRALRMASRSRAALLHAGSAEEMMAAFCRCISEEGGYSLVWTGTVVAGSNKDLLASEITVRLPDASQQQREGGSMVAVAEALRWSR